MLEEQENVRKLRINLGGRSVTLEIHAGEHGKMDHFESLQHSCRTAGLIVPELPREAPSDIEALVRILLLLSSIESTPSLAPRSAATARRFFRSAEEKQTCSHEGGAVFDLNEAAAKFNHWMTAYIHHGATHSEELVNWLFEDLGAKMVSKYEDFYSLAEKLKSMGYDIPSPPEKAEFERGCAEFEKREAYRAHEHGW